MLKTITKIGDSQVLMFDAALCELAGLKVGDQINVTVHDGGVVILTPLCQTISAGNAAASAQDLIRRNDALFKRLA